MDEVDTMIEDCETRSHRLSDWETTFIDSVSNQRGKGKRLTDPQVDTLTKIWEKVTAKG